MGLRRAVPAAVAIAVIAAPAAGAHVTVQPKEAPAGGFVRLDVRVPNEKTKADTTRVQFQLPDGFVSVLYQPLPGWTVHVKTQKLAKPVVNDDGEQVTEEVREIDWSGHGRDGRIAPGQFQDFGLSVAIPDGKPGSKLTFKALQTYDDGAVVRWIGPPTADEPAPQVTLTAAAGAGGGTATTPQAPAKSAAAAAGSGDFASKPTPQAPAKSAAAAAGSGDFASKRLGIAAVVLGALGLLLGAAALAVVARRRATPA